MRSGLEDGVFDDVARLETVQAVRSIRLVRQRRTLECKTAACSDALHRLDRDDLLVRGHEIAWSAARALLKAGCSPLRAHRSLDAERSFLDALRGELLSRRQRLQEQQQRLMVDREGLARRCFSLAWRVRLLDERRVQGESRRSGEVEMRDEDELVHRRWKV